MHTHTKSNTHPLSGVALSRIAAIYKCVSKSAHVVCHALLPCCPHACPLHSSPTGAQFSLTRSALNKAPGTGAKAAAAVGSLSLPPAHSHSHSHSHAHHSHQHPHHSYHSHLSRILLILRMSILAQFAEGARSGGGWLKGVRILFAFDYWQRHN